MNAKILIFLLLYAGCFGSTHYIDFASGSDSNNGTSKTTPWKHHPYMVGSTISGYVHSAGDRFIFKGGVTWDHTCFGMSIDTGGAAGARDYYGFDATWYAGSSWTRPIFSKNSSYSGQFMALTAGHVYIEQIEFTGFRDDGSTPYVANIDVGVQPDVYIKSCYFHGWSYTGGATDDNLDCVKSYTGDNPNGDTQIVDGCTFDGGGIAIGMAMHGCGQMINCLVKNMPNGFLPTAYNAVCANNEFTNIIVSDFGRHENIYENNGVGVTERIYNNYIHDCPTGVIMFLGGFGGKAYVYNNVICNTSRQFLDIEGRNTMGNIYIWNNTIECGTSNPFHETGTGSVPILHIENNHIITTASLTHGGYDGVYGTLVTNNEIVQTQAAATSQGFTQANKYAPTTAGTVLNGAGVPDTDTGSTADILGVSRPQAGNRWDVGAYEFGSSAAQPPAGVSITPTISH